LDTFALPSIAILHHTNRANLLQDGGASNPNAALMSVSSALRRGTTFTTTAGLRLETNNFSMATLTAPNVWQP
jgi:hypothetical protein